ncbi:MAG: hypothetical protein ACXIVO_13795 [Glycocaulis sp.]
MSLPHWPSAGAFAPVDGNTRNTDPVTVSVVKSPKRGQQVTLSLSGALCAHHQISKGDRFAVSIAENASGHYIRLTRDKAGWARVSAPSGFGKPDAALRRMLVRLGSLSSHDLPALPKQAVEYRTQCDALPVDREHESPVPADLVSLTVHIPKGRAEARRDTGALRAIPPERPLDLTARTPCPKDSPAAQAARRLSRQGLGVDTIAAKVSEDQNVRVDAAFVRAAVEAGQP